jgi:hypothetical protein
MVAIVRFSVATKPTEGHRTMATNEFALSDGFDTLRQGLLGLCADGEEE